MESLVIILYPLVAVISTIGYLPQLKKLFFATRRPQNISLTSWYIWTLGSFISLLYGVYHLHDHLFILTCSINLFLVGLTTSLIVYNSYFRFEAPLQPAKVKTKKH